MVLKVTYTLQTKCKTCFRGPRMVLHVHFKKYIITLGVWFLMYPRRPPRPPVWQKTTLFPDFSFGILPLGGPIEKNPYMTVHCSVFFEGGVDISYPQWKAVVPVDVDYLSLSRYPSSFSFTLQTFVRHLSHFP